MNFAYEILGPANSPVTPTSATKSAQSRRAGEVGSSDIAQDAS